MEREMGLVIEQRPLNPDTRTWWQKFRGDRYTPLHRYPADFVWGMVHEADRSNRENEIKRRCKIGRIRLTT